MRRKRARPGNPPRQDTGEQLQDRGKGKVWLAGNRQGLVRTTGLSSGIVTGVCEEK